MNNNKKNAGRKKSAIPGLIILAAVLVFNAVEDPEIAVTILVPVVILGAAAAIISAVKKGSAGKTAAAQSRPVQARPVQTRMPQAGRTPAVRAAQEEAIHCAHSRGKEKYLEQLDGFLANGIIDKAEYRLMRDRYSKLQIEDDYH